MAWFAYSGKQVLAEYEDSGALDAFQPSRKFVYGAYFDEPLLLLSCSELAGGGRTETAYYYHQDRNFNVIALTDDTGQLAERYTYSAYGERATLQDAGLANPYFFTGRHFDAELTIYYYRARYHDPALGRFLSRDPLGYIDGMSLYEYVKGMPLLLQDPSGKKLGVNCGKWFHTGEWRYVKFNEKLLITGRYPRTGDPCIVRWQEQAQYARDCTFCGISWGWREFEWKNIGSNLKTTRGKVQVYGENFFDFFGIANTIWSCRASPPSP